MSASDGSGTGDVESREKNFPFKKKSTCKLSRFSAVYIDARRVSDDLPWDETGEIITKNTPMYDILYIKTSLTNLVTHQAPTLVLKSGSVFGATLTL